jgi:membrane protein
MATSESGQLAHAPTRVRDLDAKTWWGTLKRTVTTFQEAGVTDWAAALTYYGVLSIFPALIALVSILGLVGASATDPLLENLTELAPGPANEILTNAINSIADSSGSAGIALLIGIAGALWAASGYVGAFSRATNRIYDVEEGRPFWKLKPFQIALTAIMLVLLAGCAIAVVATGPIAEEIGSVIGLGSTALDIWDVAKWPVIALIVAGMFAVLYWAAPNVKHEGFSWITAGGLLAVIIWIAASGLFAFYVSNFGSYNATYGALAGVIIFLIWLWITNIAMLLGAAFNAELERGRELEGGVRREDTIALDHREAPDSGDEAPPKQDRPPGP